MRSPDCPHFPGRCATGSPGLSANSSVSIPFFAGVVGVDPGREIGGLRRARETSAADCRDRPWDRSRAPVCRRGRPLRAARRRGRSCRCRSCRHRPRAWSGPWSRTAGSPVRAPRPPAVYGSSEKERSQLLVCFHPLFPPAVRRRELGRFEDRLHPIRTGQRTGGSAERDAAETALPVRADRDRTADGVRQLRPRLVGHQEEILESYSVSRPARVVETGLQRQDVARRRESRRRSSSGSEARQLVELEADTVPEPVHVAGRASRVRSADVGGRPPRTDRRSQPEDPRRETPGPVAAS